MIFYDGTYRLYRRIGPRRDLRHEPSACSWRVRIIDLSISLPDVMHLRPFIVVAGQSGEGIFKTNCAESLGKKICRDFELGVSQILWIEYFSHDPGQMYVATFRPKSYFGTDTFYFVHWRPIKSNELEAIRPFIPESENVKIGD